MVTRIASLSLMLLLPAAVLAQQPARAPTAFEQAFSLQPATEVSSLEGSWALAVDGTAIFRFDLKRSGSGWSAAWSRPRSFASDGASFSNLTGPAVTVAASKGQTLGGWVELTFDDPRPGAVPDVFRLRLMPDGKAEALYVGTGFPPLVLEKVPAERALGPWTAGRTYRRAGVVVPPGASMVSFSPPADARPAQGPAQRLGAAVAPAPTPTPRPAPTGEPQGAPAMIGR